MAKRTLTKAELDEFKRQMEEAQSEIDNDTSLSETATSFLGGMSTGAAVSGGVQNVLKNLVQTGDSDSILPSWEKVKENYFAGRDQTQRYLDKNTEEHPYAAKAGFIAPLLVTAGAGAAGLGAKGIAAIPAAAKSLIIGTYKNALSNFATKPQAIAAVAEALGVTPATVATAIGEGAVQGILDAPAEEGKFMTGEQALTSGVEGAAINAALLPIMGGITATGRKAGMLAASKKPPKNPFDIIDETIDEHGNEIGEAGIKDKPIRDEDLVRPDQKKETPAGDKPANTDEELDLTRPKETNQEIQDELDRLNKITGEKKPGGSSFYEGAQWANRRRALERLNNEKNKRVNEGTWNLAGETFEEVHPVRDMPEPTPEIPRTRVQRDLRNPPPWVDRETARIYDDLDRDSKIRIWNEDIPIDVEVVIRNPTAPNERIGDYPERGVPPPAGIRAPPITWVPPTRPARPPRAPQPPPPAGPTQGELFKAMDEDEMQALIEAWKQNIKNKTKSIPAETLAENTAMQEALQTMRPRTETQIQPVQRAYLERLMPTTQGAVNPEAMMAAGTTPRMTYDNTVKTIPNAESFDISGTPISGEPISGLSSSNKQIKNSKSYFENRKNKEPYFTEDELDEIDEFHPLFEEPKIAAAKANASPAYQAALENFHPISKLEKADGILLMNSGLAPLQITRNLEPKKLYNPNEENFYTKGAKLGHGGFGRAYTVIDQNGKAKVAKLSAPVDYTPEMIASLKYERDVAETMSKIRQSATPEEQKYLRHFPVIEKILDNPIDLKNGFIFVMDQLRPMNDYEYALLFKGKSAVERQLKSKGWTREAIKEHVDQIKEKNIIEVERELKNKCVSNKEIKQRIKKLRAEDIEPEFDLPTSYRSRKPLKPSDYDNLTPNVRRFLNALEWLADEKGIKWDDLHENNVMIDPKTGEYVALDMGQFTLPGRYPPEMDTRGGFATPRTRALAVEAARKERNRNNKE